MWTGFKINYDKNAILKFKRLRYDFGSCDNYNGQVVEIRTGALSQVSGVSGPSHRDRSTDLVQSFVFQTFVFQFSLQLKAIAVVLNIQWWKLAQFHIYVLLKKETKSNKSLLQMFHQLVS